MDPSTLQPGYKLDRYELLCPLAYGGMASVWLARFGGRLGFERLVVVKMILPQYSQDPRFQEMFLDEARIASRIEHTNVARILDVGEHDTSYYIVMEWVDGDSLSKIMRAAEHKKQRVAPGVALRVLADAAAGLHAAHVLKERDGTPLGVVHRDVSPQNILVANSGATMLIDFGVAKARDRVSQETTAGQLKGKIRYMAPEQALGNEIDARADVWALGAILYELFAGEPAFDGPNEVATLHKLTSGQPVKSLPSGVPPDVRAIVDRSLTHDPEKRYGSALELNLALEAAMVQIGEATSVAVVANYTGHLLMDRKAARKKAVDAALATSRARDGGERSSARGSIAALAPAPSSRHLVASQTPTVAMVPASQETSRATRDSGGPMGLQEVPSATSSSTLGSAAMEYPMEYPPVFAQEAARRRRVMGIALGVSVLAGVLGTALIVSSAMRRREPELLSPPAAAVAVVPGEPASATASAMATASASASATASASASATASASASAEAPRPAATTHPKAPTTKDAPKPKPTPPAATTGKKDYGF